MRPIIKNHRALFVGASVALWPAVALSATTADSNAFASEEVVVTGKRMPADSLHLNAPVQDLPISVQAVSIDIIEDQGQIRLGDAVRNISGVTRKEAYFGLTDSFNVRGFDASVGLFNGFRHDYYGSVVDLAHVETVEVIKGPDSVTTGFLEPGGVVNVIAKRPLDIDLSEIELEGGSYDRARAQFDFSRKIDDTLGIRLTGAAETTESFRDFVRSHRGTIGGAFDWAPRAGTKVELSLYYEKIYALPDRGLPNNPVSFEVPTSRFAGMPTDTYRLAQKESSLVIEQALFDGVSARAGVDWSRTDDIRVNTQLEDQQPDGRSFSRDFTIVPGSYDTKTAFGELDGAADVFGIGNKLTAGIDWTRQQQRYNFGYTNEVPVFDFFDPDYTPFTPGSLSPDIFVGTTKDHGIYFNDLISIGRYVKLLAGVRHDWFSYRDHDFTFETQNNFSQEATTPRVGVVVQPLDGLSIYANYARSFNPQQFTQLASGESPAPSKGTQYEAGVKFQSADGRYRASAAIYQIVKSNVATPDPDDPTGTFSVLSGKQRSRGIEGDFYARPIEGLQTLLALTLMHAEVTEDEVLPLGDGLVNVPRFQATLWGRYDIPSTPFGVGATLYYVGGREAQLPNTFRVPNYTRFDAAVFWKATDHVEFAVNLQNLGDTRYYDSQDNALFPGSPRSVLVTARLTY